MADRYQVNFNTTKELLDLIDDYHYRRRTPHRKAAIEHLLRYALAADPPYPLPEAPPPA